MNIIHKIIQFTNMMLWENNVLVFLLIFAAIYFSVKTKFVQIRLFKKAVKEITKESNLDGVSSMETFFLSTASRVGAGNIVGVIAAISIGGPGSIFWMWLIALLGGATSFVESTLAVMYREKRENNKYIGGTPYILEKRLNKKYLGIVYAILSIVCYFGVTQVMSNTITESIISVYDIKGINLKFYLSLLSAILIALVIFNKNEEKNRIIVIINKIVPIMAIMYLILVSFILIKNITYIPSIFKLIFLSAFGLKQSVGATVGLAVMHGIRRGLFSNEAGSGGTNYAAALVNNDNPISQGFVQMLGVFADTLVICTGTAFIILLAPKSDLTGMFLFQSSLNYHIGFIAKPISILLLFFFSSSTILAITFFGENALYFISKKKILDTIYKIGIVIMVYKGAISQNKFVWSLADFGLGLMTFLNLIVLFILGKEVINLLKEYEKRES